MVSTYPTPLKNDGVRHERDYYSQYMENNPNVPNHQLIRMVHLDIRTGISYYLRGFRGLAVWPSTYLNVVTVTFGPRVTSRLSPRRCLKTKMSHMELLSFWSPKGKKLEQNPMVNIHSCRTVSTTSVCILDLFLCEKSIGIQCHRFRSKRRIIVWPAFFLKLCL